MAFGIDCFAIGLAQCQAEHRSLTPKAFRGEKPQASSVSWSGIPRAIARSSGTTALPHTQKFRPAVVAAMIEAGRRAGQQGPFRLFHPVYFSQK